MFIPDPGSEFFHLGSRVKKKPDPRSASKVFLTQKIARKYNPGCLSRTPDLNFFTHPESGSRFFTHPGSRGQSGTGSATLLHRGIGYTLFNNRAADSVKLWLTEKVKYCKMNKNVQ